MPGTSKWWAQLDFKRLAGWPMNFESRSPPAATQGNRIEHDNTDTCNVCPCSDESMWATNHKWTKSSKLPTLQLPLRSIKQCDLWYIFLFQQWQPPLNAVYQTHPNTISSKLQINFCGPLPPIHERSEQRQWSGECNDSTGKQTKSMRFIFSCVFYAYGCFRK